MESSVAVISLVKRLHLSARAAIDEALVPFGISAAQYSVLRRLQDDGDQTGAELARQLFVTAQTMSRTIAGLERLGLIERIDHAENPNAVHNRLTAAGQSVTAAARKVVQAITDAVLLPLTAEERRCFEQALDRCVQAAESLANASPKEAMLSHT
jgi:DNA-binding MarR family transcriptional regulator